MSNNFEIIDYTEKSIAVFGDTKSIKDDLKAMGGRFNSRLNYNGEKAAGWIFPIHLRSEIEELLEMSEESTDTEVAFEIGRNEKHHDSDINDLPKCVKCMSFQEAIISVINDYGKDILLKNTIINILSDYNAFQESKSFKVILKHIISEGCLDQILYMKSWDSSHFQLINRFVDNTGFQYDKALYVIDSLSYALGKSQNSATYNIGYQQQLLPFQPIDNNNPATISCSSLNLTISKLGKLSKNKSIKYKEIAEQYLNSIIEYKGIEELSADIVVKCLFYCEYNSFYFRVEINGPIKIGYFNFDIYNRTDEIIETLYASCNKKKNYQISDTLLSSEEYYKTVNNISKIIVYPN